MKYKQNALLSIIILFGAINIVCAQETIDITGGNGSGNGGTVCYSVGQVACLTLSGSTGTVLQGVQQPWEVFLITNTGYPFETDVICEVYPNPASEFLKIRINGCLREGTNFQLFDATGKMIQNGQIIDNETELFVSNLLSGIYLLFIVTNESNQTKVFKIIKK